jgi:2-octaprenyl-6-methoxyphenol hydroxylase
MSEEAKASTQAPVQSTVHVPVAVIGGGPAGFAAALALAVSGQSVALVARRGAVKDNRTTAFLQASVEMLRRLGVWERVEADATPLTVMRLVDDTDRLFRAPEVRFAAAEIGLDAFGYNLGNRELVAAMEERSAELPNLVRIDGEATDIAVMTDDVTIVTSAGTTLAAQLVVGADGRHSPSRAAAGIAVKHRALSQVALTFNITHARPHRDMSTEFHTAFGPCALVPARGNRSNIVWVVSAAESERLLALSDEALGEAIERQSRSILGKCTVEPGRFAFPLSFDEPQRLATNRIALVGEAAHVVPPLGAQGLNLGLRDAASIAEIASDALARRDDPGNDAVLHDYERARRSDITSRAFVIDMANRSLLDDLLPVQMMRAGVMTLIAGITPLRRMMLREGVAPFFGLPRIMRGDNAA